MSRIESMPAAEYHAREGLGGTRIAKWSKMTPLEWHYERQVGVKETPAMALGSLCHVAVLEAHLLESDHAVAPDVDRRTKAGKEEWARFLEEDAFERTVVTAEQMRIAKAAAAAVKQREEVYGLLRAGKREVSYFVDHPDLPLQLKARVDFEGATKGHGPILLDVKTTRDLGDRFLERRLVDGGYAPQLAHYSNVVEWETGTRPNECLILWIRNVDPVDIRVHRIDPAALEIGARLCETAYREIAACQANGVWPGYPSRIDTLSLPGWYGEDHPGSEEEGEAA